MKNIEIKKLNAELIFLINHCIETKNKNWNLNYALNQNGKRLKKAIEATFKVRKTDLPDNPLVFKEEFHKSEDKQKQWTAFLRKTKLKDTSEAFNVVMERITDFLKPVVFSIKNGTDIDRIWDKSHRKWKE